jgi:hypothetical protein
MNNKTKKKEVKEMRKIVISLGNFICGCFVIFTMGFLLPFVLKQLGVNIL